MKHTFFLFGMFGAIICAPNAEQTLKNGWAIHPFSVFATLFIVMACWLISDDEMLNSKPPKRWTPTRYDQSIRKERTIK